jgi:Chalcone isomerase-like
MKRLLVMVLIVFMISPAAVAKQIGDVTLPDSLMAGKNELILNGAGFRKKLFIKVYAGGLYLKKKNHDHKKIIDSDESMALRLHIVSGVITTKKMTDAIDKGFKNSTGENITSFKIEMAKFKSFFADEIKKDNIFDIIYVPTEGISVYKNESLKGTIQGFDFKKIVFGIWLGEKPADAKLKKRMLGE